MKKPNKCPFCDHSSAERASLKKHIKSIHENRQQNCSKCNKSFKDKEKLDRHINLIHEVKQPHKCNFCDHRFLYRIDLKMHKEIVHGPKPYKCSVCEKCFKTKWTIRKHVDVIHDRKKDIEIQVM